MKTSLRPVCLQNPKVCIVGEKNPLKWFCHTNTHTLMNTLAVLTAILPTHALCGQSTEAYTSTVQVDTYMYLYIYAWTCTCNRLLISMSANWVGILSLLKSPPIYLTLNDCFSKVSSWLNSQTVSSIIHFSLYTYLLRQADTQTLEEILQMLLEIINSGLTHTLHNNPHLVYSLLYQREVFAPFHSRPGFIDLVQNIEMVSSMYNVHL